MAAPSRADEPLLSGLAESVQLPLVQAVLDAALSLVVTMSQEVIGRADGVSITLPRGGRLQTVAASNDVVLQMDHDQYDTAQGPCLDAATSGTSCSSAVLDLEQRWPQFVPRARSRGISSILSEALTAAGEPLGALNLYSRAPDSFAVREKAWAARFAAEASRVLVQALSAPSAQELGRELAGALGSRELVTLARGIVMTRRGISSAAAQRFLLDISRTTSRPLLGICRDVVATAEPDTPGPAAGGPR